MSEMNREYQLHDNTAARLYAAAMMSEDPILMAAGETLAAQFPEVRQIEVPPPVKAVDCEIEIGDVDE